jgi:hypothetical protein
MTWKAMMFAALGAALVLGSGAARANERHGSKSAAHEHAGGEATSMAPGQAGEQAGVKEISGRVVQASPSKLYLEHMGAVVEFNLKDTQFSGGDLRSFKDLSEGQQVKASFTIENKTTNVANRVSLAGEAGTTRPGAPEREPAATPGGERPDLTPSVPGMPPREPSTTPPP